MTMQNSNMCELHLTAIGMLGDCLCEKHGELSQHLNTINKSVSWIIDTYCSQLLIDRGMFMSHLGISRYAIWLISQHFVLGFSVQGYLCLGVSVRGHLRPEGSQQRPYTEVYTPSHTNLHPLTQTETYMIRTKTYTPAMTSSGGQRSRRNASYWKTYLL